MFKIMKKICKLNYCLYVKISYNIYIHFVQFNIFLDFFLLLNFFLALLYIPGFGVYYFRLHKHLFLGGLGVLVKIFQSE